MDLELILLLNASDVHKSPISSIRALRPFCPRHSLLSAVTFVLHSELLSHRHTLENGVGVVRRRKFLSSIRQMIFFLSERRTKELCCQGCLLTDAPAWYSFFVFPPVLVIRTGFTIRAYWKVARNRDKYCSLFGSICA